MRFLLSTAGLCLTALSLLDPARADLTYYLYSEEEEQSNQEEASVIVLRAIGSLPFHKSTFTTKGEGCPEMVWSSGGVNPKYLCAGAVHPDDNSDVPSVDSDVAFFPIASADLTEPRIVLPLRFSAFQRSRGTPTGLITWRNALAVHRSVATNEDQPQFLDAVSMGMDTSKDAFNTDALASIENGEVIAEWWLLENVGGDPVMDGGRIKLVKGKPPSSTNQESTSEAVATNNDAPVTQKEPQQQQAICNSITDYICDDDKTDKFGTLCSLMMQTGLDTMLSFPDGSYFTLYAPINEGFTRAFFNQPQPALLSGHDLTRLLLNHLIVTDPSRKEQMQTIGALGPEPDHVLKYEEMVCGAKTEMASGQITKTGCDANSDVAYVLGTGNGGNLTPRPKFLEVDHQACNGVVHTVDFVVMPGIGLPPVSQIGSQEHAHQTSNQGVVDIGDSDGAFSAKTAVNATKEESEKEIAPFDTETNQLDEAEVFSFFQEQKQDILEEEIGPVIPSVASPSFFQDKEDETDNIDTSEPSRKENNDEETKTGGFHSFFGRTGVQKELHGSTTNNAGRPGSLRRR